MDFDILYNLILITFLGILVAFNPTLVIVDLFLVLRTRRPILNSVLLTAGFVSSILILLALASFLVDLSSDISLGNLRETINLPPLIDVLAGGLLLGYSANRLLTPPAKPSKVVVKKFEIPQKPYQIFMFGFFKAALSVTNIFAVIILAKLAAFNDWNPMLGIVAILWILLVGVIPLAAVVYYHQFKHTSLQAIDQRVNEVLNRDNQMLITYCLLAVGAAFAISGLKQVLA